MSQLLRALSAKPKTVSTQAEMQLREQPLKILFAGQIKSGKSSVINCLLGEKLLPESISRHTAAIHYCRFGESPSMTVHFRDDAKSPERAPLDAAHLQTYLDDGGALIKFIEVEHPRLPVGLDLIDSPGINDRDPYRNAVVHSFMTEADALVFVFDATSAGHIAELEFLRKYIGGLTLRTCVFLANKAELLSDPDRQTIEKQLVKLLQEQISKDVQPSQILKISTRVQEDPELSPERLVQWLSACLANKTKILRARTLLSDLRVQLREREILTCRVAGHESQLNNHILGIWQARLQRVSHAFELLAGEKSKAISTFKLELQHGFDQAAHNIAPKLPHMAGAPVEYYQGEIQGEIAKAVGNAKEAVAAILERVPLISESEIELGALSGQVFESQSKAQRENAAGEAEISSAGAVLGGLSSFGGLSTLLYGHPLVAVGLMFFGQRYLHKKAVHQQIAAQENLLSTIEESLRETLTHTAEELGKEFEGWYDSQIREANATAERLLRELYAAFDATTIEGMAEAKSRLAQIEQKIIELQKELRTAS